MKGNRLLLVIVVLSSGVALFSMLAYNFFHTANLLSSYIDPMEVGFIAAFGVEMSVVGLSITIGTRKWHNLDTRGFYIVLLLVVVVSFLANVSQGHLQKYGEEITWNTITGFDWLQGVIGLAATGLISVITMAMAEIIGQYIVQIAHKEVEEAEVVGKVPQTKAEWCRAVYDVIPNASPTLIAEVVGSHLDKSVSVATASRSQK